MEGYSAGASSVSFAKLGRNKARRESQLLLRISYASSRCSLLGKALGQITKRGLCHAMSNCNWISDKDLLVQLIMSDGFAAMKDKSRAQN